MLPSTTFAARTISRSHELSQIYRPCVYHCSLTSDVWSRAPEACVWGVNTFGKNASQSSSISLAIFNSAVAVRAVFQLHDSFQSYRSGHKHIDGLPVVSGPVLL